MRFRAIAVALVFPLGLLAACGDDDGGLTARTDDDEQTDTTDEAESDTTEAEETDTTEAEETDTTQEEESDTTVEEEESDTTVEEETDTTAESSDDTLGPDIDLTDVTNPDGTLKDEIRDVAIEQMVSQGLTEEQAGCFIDQMVEILGVDFIAELGSTGGDASAVLEALTPEQQGQLIDAILACDISPADLGG